MAEISFGGLATGLPTEDLVDSLMAIERRPIDRLEADKEYESQRLKAYGQFNTRLDDLRSAVGNLNITSEVQTTSVRLSSEESISASSNGRMPITSRHRPIQPKKPSVFDLNHAPCIDYSLIW